jgi:hypothetical protein
MPALQAMQDGSTSTENLKKSRTRGWISQGSEKEMELETNIPSREKVN